MSMSKAREMREERAKLVAEAQKLITDSKEKRLGKEDSEKFERMMADADALKVSIDQIERVEAADKELRETTKPAEAAIVRAGDDNQLAETRKKQEEVENRAFRTFLYDGPSALTVEERKALKNYTATERRDMGVGTTTLGGYFVPQGFVQKVEVAQKYYGKMLESSDIMDTATGNPLPYPSSNDTGVTGEIVGEGQQVSDQDVTIGRVEFGAYKFSTKMVKVSIELMQDSAFDMEKFLIDAFGLRLGRILNTKFTVGSGSSEPEGLITAVGTGNAVTAVGSSANDGSGATGANSIGWIDLVKTEHKVDPWYRQGASWQFHDSTLSALKQNLDKYGHPLWVPGVTSNAPDTILSYPYWINNDMATIGANNVTVAFGQMKKYIVRRVKELGVLRLTERFADYGQIAFIGFARYDGNLIDAGTHPVVVLQQAAS